MKQSIIAAFKTQNRAEEALEALLDAGFSRNDTRLMSLADTHTDSSSKDKSNEDKSLGQKIGEMFGMGDDDKDSSKSDDQHGQNKDAIRVDVDDEADAERAQDIIKHFEPTGVDRRSADDLGKSSGLHDSERTLGDRSTAGALGATGSHASDQRNNETVVPVVEEELEIGKRETTQGGVNVTSRNYEESVKEDVNLHEEHTDVSSRPVDRKATKEDLAFGEVNLEERDTREEVVVNKEARVVEEVVVSREGSNRTKTIEEDLRRTDVDVEHVAEDDATRSSHVSDTDKKGKKRT
ncbi:DUF2382 domain-containing protein [Halomonas sp. PR-M31]|uniref:DUF2382 domain-containing protein n=1 Tax=Halomonas sp. PR-M31 TaxID=1471202 RepID=UPI00069DBD21|nr:DUF2382 domain-containing protein [Halomonas sp. PR-M31]